MSGDNKPDILDALRKAVERGIENDPKAEMSIPLSQELEELRVMVDSYSQSCRFKARDIITPRLNSFYANAGRPHVVLEVLEKPRYTFDLSEEGLGNHSYGAKVDARVCLMLPNKKTNRDTGGTKHACVPYWVESWQWDLWKVPENKAG